MHLKNLPYEIFSGKVLYYSLKMVGLAAFSLDVKFLGKNKNCVSKEAFTCSRLGMIYNLIMVVLIMVLTYLTLKVSYKLRFFGNGSELDMFIETIKTVWACLSSIIILLMFGTRQKKVVHCGNTIVYIRERLITVNRTTYSENKFLWKSIMKISLVVIVMYICICTSWDVHVDRAKLIYFIDATLCDMIIIFTVILYGIKLKMMEQLLKIINTNISYISREFIQAGNDVLQNNVVKQAQITCDKLSCLQNLHLLLFNVSEDLINFYSASIFLCTLYIFSSVILNTFYILKPVVTGSAFMLPIMSSHVFAQFIHCTISLMILTKCVTDLVSESNRTGKIVSEWLAKLTNLRVENEATKFLLYLKEHKMQFSVFEIFSLDNSMLLSITSSITTYLVILLQLHSHHN